jgi:transposase
MNEKHVFGLALGLEGTPWVVSEIRFDPEARRLDIDLDFPPGSRFPHPVSGQPAPIHDTQHRSWRHLNFFQFECYVHAWVPRVDGGAGGGGVKQVSVPWARPQSGFTLLMESLIVLCARTGMTVAEVGRMIGEYAQRCWKVLFHQVDRAHEVIDVKEVKDLSIDEVAKRRGHDYLTVVSEPGEGKARPSRVLYVTEGKDAETVQRAREWLQSRGVEAGQIQRVCADMSPAYALGVRQSFPEATLVFDCFHVVSAVSTAVDAVRRREQRQFPELLTGTRWLWLKGEDKLSQEQQEQRRGLLRRGRLQTGRAFERLEALRDILKQSSPQAEADLRWWCGWVARSRLPEMVKAGQMVRRHWDGIVAYLRTRITNAAAEALNGIVQTVKRKSRGFRTFEYFRCMIYLVASRLTFNLPSPVPSTHTNSH